jgi:hypothetical protein
MRSNTVPGTVYPDYQLPNHTRALRDPGKSQRYLAKRPRSFHVYQMSPKDDYFYNHPNTVLLGFLGAVGAILLLLMLVFWIGYKIW